MSSKKADPIVPDGRSLGISLGDELARQGIAVSPAASAASAPALANAPRPVGDFSFDRVGKLVLRREKKGRGGKTVTVIAGLGWRARQLEDLARALRKALGCGSSVEGDTVILQGDMTERTQRWLTDRGARQIVVGN
jgi:translation initiation factor 1